jgi:hypothetical protein
MKQQGYKKSNKLRMHIHTADPLCFVPLEEKGEKVNRATGN